VRKNYDFSKSRKNPYAKRLKKQITMRVDAETIGYFKSLSSDTGMNYQVLMDLYLRECARKKKKPKVSWDAA
jgi:predicted DNA binding CopG/RHH family protein